MLALLTAVLCHWISCRKHLANELKWTLLVEDFTRGGFRHSSFQTFSRYISRQDPRTNFIKPCDWSRHLIEGTLCRYRRIRSQRLVCQCYAPPRHDPRFQRQPRLRHFWILLHHRNARILPSRYDHQNQYLPANKGILGSECPLSMLQPASYFRGRHRHQRCHGSGSVASAHSTCRSADNALEEKVEGLSAVSWRLRWALFYWDRNLRPPI